MWTLQMLEVLLILFPGLLARFVIGSLTPRRKQNVLSVLTEALILSVFAYLLALQISPTDLSAVFKNIGGRAVSDSLSTAPQITESLAMLKWWEGAEKLFVTASALALVFALLWGYLIRFDLLFGFLRWTKVTKNTGRNSTWFDILHDYGGHYVIVSFEDGREFMGHPSYFSEEKSEGTLFLTDVSWRVENGVWETYDVEGLLLPNANKVSHIDVLRKNKEEKAVKDEHTDRMVDRGEKTEKGSRNEPPKEKPVVPEKTPPAARKEDKK